jgi:polyisoprenyl-phosphate glycosyltransferase
MSDGGLVSVVVPILNEVAVVEELHRRLTDAVTPIGSYELIFVDDGSTDGSWGRMVALAAQDEHLHLVRLSRNFGHQAAITAGLVTAQGNAVVVMDGDLQDPPELIPTLVAKWREGYDVVYTIHVRLEGETWFKRVTSELFYKFFGRLSDTRIPGQSGDFRLMSRRAVDALNRMPERARFLRGMSFWIGFPHVGVPYNKEARYAGTTKFPLRKMLKFAADATTSFSAVPLRLISVLGFVTVFFCAIYLVYTLCVRLFTNDTVQGWTSVIVVVLFLGGVQLLSLGIVAEYIGRIFEETKARPLYLVEEVVHQLDRTAATRERDDRAQGKSTAHSSPLR